MAVTPGIPNSARAQGFGLKSTFKNLRQGSTLLLPQRVAVIGQGTTGGGYSLTKAQLSSALDVANTYGFGSPLHLAALQLFPTNGDGLGTIPCTFYPLDDDASGAPSVGDITPTGTATKAGSFIVTINNTVSVAIAIEVGDVVAGVVGKLKVAIDATLEMPVTTTDNTTDLIVTSKWEGLSANDIQVSIAGPSDTGITFVVTQPVGGLANPDATAINAALAQFGNDWETIVVNCMQSTDTVALDALSVFNEGRWDPQVSKPFIALAGSDETVVATAIAVPNARLTDRTNSQPMAPGSGNLPMQIAAANASRIARIADADPAQGYIRQSLPFITPGLPDEQWTYPEKDQAIKAGTSSSDIIDNIVVISDTVTFYHPVGEQDPAYRSVVDIMRLMNVMYNISLIFDGPEWQGAPLIPDDQPTINPNARKPRNAVAEVNSVLDGLGLLAIISDPETAKASTVAVIDDQNPDRLNIETTIQLSGNTNIKDFALNFGFFFGPQTIVN